MGAATYSGAAKEPVQSKDETTIQRLTTQYVREIQTYDYRTVKEIDGLNYLTPDFRELVEKHFANNVCEFKEKKEVQRVKSIEITSQAISGADAYVTYFVKVQGTRAGKHYWENARGDLILKRINGQWLIDLDDLEDQKD